MDWWMAIGENGRIIQKVVVWGHGGGSNDGGCIATVGADDGHWRRVQAPWLFPRPGGNLAVTV